MPPGTKALPMNQNHELRARGLKVTLPRTKVLELLHSEAAHMSADEIHRRLALQGLEIGLATVYRVLGQLERAGLVQRQSFEAGHAVFEMARPGHHDHLVCVRCGRVEEFFDAQIEALQCGVARDRGFELIEHHLSLLGVCAACHAAGGG